jgi:hypothetical protein
MPRGNVAINREIAKEVKDGIVYQVLPEIEYEGQMCPSFTTVSPIKYKICGCNFLHQKSLFTKWKITKERIHTRN